MRMNLMVFNAQMPLNKLNKSRGMLVRNLFSKRKRRNKCRGRRKGFEGKGKDRISKKKNNILEIILYYIKNNIIFNLVCYSE
jgi:hypothetical protein